MISTTLPQSRVSLNLSRPIYLCKELGLNTSTTNENSLDSYVFEEFKKWGLVPFSKTLFPVNKNLALYPNEKLTQAIIKSFFFGFNSFFFGFDEDFGKPSKEKLDASSLAIRMGYPGQLGRSSLNAFVVGELEKIGLAPNQGRLGAIGLGIGLNIGDGGVYPVNNPIVKRIIREFFEDVNSLGFNSEVERYAIRISA